MIMMMANALCILGRLGMSERVDSCLTVVLYGCLTVVLRLSYVCLTVVLRLSYGCLTVVLRLSISLIALACFSNALDEVKNISPRQK
jgi:hypothetical protein